jgi:hypothetical protein
MPLLLFKFSSSPEDVPQSSLDYMFEKRFPIVTRNEWGTPATVSFELASTTAAKTSLRGSVGN